MPAQADGSAEVQLAQIGCLIARTRRILRSAWVLTGTALSIGLFPGTISVAALSDLIIPFSMPLRFAALCGIALPTLLALVTGVARPALRRLSDNSIARRIERIVPQIQSRLVTTIDIAVHPWHGSHSEAFRRRLISETSQRVSAF